MGGPGGSVTYGDYFTAARDFLSADGMAVVIRALQGVCETVPEVIRIHLVKHGALYHPAHVSLTAGQAQAHLVLNVAISAEGRERLPVEVAFLRELARVYPQSYLPEVYGWGVGTAGRHGDLPMFAGQWLDGYHEVHHTISQGSIPRPWVVWDSLNPHWYFSRRQSDDFYRQAVFILTYYLNPINLHAITEWHHAAGDFVVKRKKNGHIDVRLITVRRYGALFDLAPDTVPDLNTLLEGLAAFFLRTSLWMRLDRLDGVGELDWSDDDALLPIWEGFVRGLRQMTRVHRLPRLFAQAALHYLAAHDHNDLRRLGLGILARCPAALPEVTLMRRHLSSHSAGLAGVIRAGQ